MTRSVSYYHCDVPSCTGLVELISFEDKVVVTARVKSCSKCGKSYGIKRAMKLQPVQVSN